MQLEALKVFCDVVESQSFSKAAVLNFVSQSAVSQQIRSLEDKYEHKLIERGKRNLAPTQAGQILYQAAKGVLGRLEEMEIELQRLSKRVLGTVRVATIYSVGLHELHAYVTDFMRRYPDVRVRIEYHRANRIYDQVVGNLTDIGIVAYPARRSGIRILPFREDELALVCPPEHPLARQKRTELRHLAGHPFVMFERNLPTRRAVERILREADVRPQVAMEFDNIETIKRAVEIGAGISILPRATVEREVSLGTLAVVRFARGGHMRPLGILIKRARQMPPAVNYFIELLQGEPPEPSPPK
ncbi:MAG: LysR family transcriptional regulator [Candidatus Eisenbacteria bacterium]|nr:LysR family transcriptional regulator [Candidatus Eisenbacteria bacterium]